ncbi:MAG TPA: ECF transporter S component, partial [Atopostipes sp.]|nr:ECF transporter S component [Atopostipes sp.]
LIVVNLIAWAIAAPSLDVLIYAEPVNKVFVQGIVAALVNAFSTALIGWVLIEAYVRTRTKSGSLSEK